MCVGTIPLDVCSLANHQDSRETVAGLDISKVTSKRQNDIEVWHY